MRDMFETPLIDVSRLENASQGPSSSSSSQERTVVFLHSDRTNGHVYESTSLQMCAMLSFVSFSSDGR